MGSHRVGQCFEWAGAGLVALLNSMPSDVRQAWHVEIDLRDASRPAVTHVKAQGKSHEKVSIRFALRVQLRYLSESAQLGFQSACLSIQDFKLNSDNTVLSHADADGLSKWHSTTSTLLAQDNNAELKEWQQDMENLWTNLHPLKGSTPHDIFRCG